MVAILRSIKNTLPPGGMFTNNILTTQILQNHHGPVITASVLA
jgi:hypothetical protein